ncbi:MAG: hypothetical protein L6R36_000152 [Xanthoria steineri]|nr:MAG: hypothetical protein L6R36_000152 [Xanthoria steineri]
MTTKVKSIYHVENDTMIAYAYSWPVEEIAYNEIAPQPMTPDPSWTFQVPQLNGTLHSVFTNVAALVAVAIFSYCLCKWSQYHKICPTPRVTFNEQLAKKDAELERSVALNAKYVGKLDSIRGKRALEREELKVVTEELQWYCVNHPILEAANLELIDQNARALKNLFDSEEELEGWRKEAGGLRERLTRLTASVASSPTHVAPVRKTKAREENSDWKIQLDTMKRQKEDAVANEVRSEAAKEQAFIEREEGAKAKSDFEAEIVALKSTNEDVTGTVKKLEAENKEQAKELESAIAKGDLLESTVHRLEEELKETKDDLKNTEKAARPSVDNDALLQARDTTIGQLESKIKILEGVELHAKELEKRYTADVKDWDNSKMEYNNTIQSLRTQYDIVTKNYNDNLQVHEHERNGLTQQVEVARTYHQQSATHVNHLKHILEGIMKGLAVNGDLDSPSGLETVRLSILHSLGLCTGYRSLILGVMEKSGVVGSVDNLDGLQTVQQKFIEFFDSFAPMQLTPKVVRSLMEELTTLQKFKAEMLASQSEGQTEDPVAKLREVKANLKLVGQELIKARSEATESKGRINKLKEDLKRLDEQKKGGNRASEVNQSKLRTLEGDYEQLKKSMEDLESRRGPLTQQVEDLNNEVKKLRKEKEDLKSQKWKLLNQYNKARSEGPKAEEQSPSPEKRGHSNGNHSDDEVLRSSKQARNSILAGGDGVS